MLGRVVRLAAIAAGLVWAGLPFRASSSLGDDAASSPKPSAGPAGVSAEPKAKARERDPSPAIRQADKAASKNGACRKAEHGFTPEREAAALTFVHQYHPELARLLPILKKKDEGEYCQAIRDLFRTSERLASFREKFPDRYDIELKAWQLKSQIQLLATRLRITPDDVRLRDELKAVLLEQTEIRLRLLAEERQELAERLRRLDEQIDTLQNQKQSTADQQLQLLVRGSHKKPPLKQKPDPTGKSKPARSVKEQGKPGNTAPKPDDKPAADTVLPHRAENDAK